MIHKDDRMSDDEEDGADTESLCDLEDEEADDQPVILAPRHPGGRKPRNRLELIKENKKLNRKIRNMKMQRVLCGTIKRDGPATDIEKRSDAVLRLVDECGHLYEKSPRNRDQLSLEAGMHVNYLREAGLHFENDIGDVFCYYYAFWRAQ